MIQCNSLNVKLSDSQLNKLKSTTKNETWTTLGFSSNMIGDSNGETNFPYKLLITDRQVSKLYNAYANNLSTDINCKFNYLK